MLRALQQATIAASAAAAGGGGGGAAAAGAGDKNANANANVQEDLVFGSATLAPAVTAAADPMGAAPSAIGQPSPSESSPSRIVASSLGQAAVDMVVCAEHADLFLGTSYSSFASLVAAIRSYSPRGSSAGSSDGSSSSAAEAEAEGEVSHDHPRYRYHRPFGHDRPSFIYDDTGDGRGNAPKRRHDGGLLVEASDVSRRPSAVNTPQPAS